MREKWEERRDYEHMPTWQKNMVDTSSGNRLIEKYGLENIRNIATAYDRAALLAEVGQHPAKPFRESLKESGIDKPVSLRDGRRIYRMVYGDLKPVFQRILEKLAEPENEQLNRILAEKFDDEVRAESAPQTPQAYLEQYEEELARMKR